MIRGLFAGTALRIHDERARPAQEGASHATHGLDRKGLPRIDDERAVPAQEERFMGIGMRELVVILLVVLLLFGAKKLRTIGSDLGAAVKGFKKSMNEGEEEELHPPRQIPSEGKDAEFAETSKTSQKSDRSA
jgi:sec-independent protein translocase protein TatA